jgi:hypothetical protein
LKKQTHSERLCSVFAFGYQPDPVADESAPQSLDPLSDAGLLPIPPAVAEEGAGAAEGALDDCVAEEGALAVVLEADDGVEGGWLCEPVPEFVAELAFAGGGVSGVKGLLLEDAEDEGAATLLDGTEGELEDWLGGGDVDDPDHPDEAGVALSYELVALVLSGLPPRP